MQGSHRRQRREWRDEKQASDERSRQEAWQGGKGITFQQRAAEDLTLSYWGVVSRSRVFFLFFCFFFFSAISSVSRRVTWHIVGAWYGLNVCVSPEIICGNPASQRYLEVDVWQVTESGWSPCGGIAVY